jgi:hypothetical protein
MSEKKNNRLCENCCYFCHEIDAENRYYFDESTGQCRLAPPGEHFSWPRVRVNHWCGKWQPLNKGAEWRGFATPPNPDRPVLLYKKGRFCKKNGMIIAYWNSVLSKWHDGDERLFEYDEFTGWMELPDPPEF